MRDLQSSPEHDLMLSNFDLHLTNDQELVKQRLKQALLLFKGEWFLNTTLGMPYYQEILAPGSSLTAIKAILVRTIEQVEGVQELIKLDLRFDEQKRILKVNFSVLDTFNHPIDMEL